jgi:hypothetical protein
VYGIRIGDIDKILRKDQGFQMFERKLELEFVEDVRKGRINEDLLNWYLSSREYRTSLGDHVLFKVDKDTENLLVSVKEHVRSMLKVRDWLEYKHEHVRKGSKPPVIVRMISGSFFSGIQNYHIICKTITSVYTKLDVFFTSVKNTDLYSQSTEQLNIDRSNMWEASNLSLTRDLKALPDYSLLKEFHKTMLSKQPILTHLLVTKHHVDRVFNTKLCVPEFLKDVVAAEIETAKKG